VATTLAGSVPAEITATTESAAAGGRPMGGVLRAAVTAGSAATDLLDPNGPTTGSMQQARTHGVFSLLTDVSPDGAYKMQLAESIEGNADATEWTITLKSGVQWHDGSPFTADDVVYSLLRQMDPASELSSAASSLDMVAPDGVTKVDDLTVKLVLTRPWSDMPAQLGQRYNSIIKAGTTEFTPETMIGTGPFKFKSYTPGERTTLTRNDNYFEDGPYVDTVELISITEPTARLNALQAGQVDAAEHIDPSQISVLEAAGLVPLIAPAGAWRPIYMNTQVEPFNDVRVRQAMKHLVDREQMVAVAQQGIGSVGNDLFASGDPLYASGIEQRTYDPEKAVSLLKEAGYEDYEFVLHTSDVEPTFVSAALIMAENAKAAGINFTTQQHPTDSFWSDVYGKVSFCFSSWGWRPFLAQWIQSFEAYNGDETNWVNKRATELVAEVASTVDEAKRTELAAEAQQLLWDDGGYIIWGSNSNISAVSAKLKGIEPHIFNPLGWYTFKDAWFDK